MVFVEIPNIMEKITAYLKKPWVAGTVGFFLGAAYGGKLPLTVRRFLAKFPGAI